jgi:hypothetical protein
MDARRCVIPRIPDCGDARGRAFPQVTGALFAGGDNAIRRSVMVSAQRRRAAETNGCVGGSMMTRSHPAARDGDSVRRFTGEQARVQDERRGDDRDNEHHTRAVRGLHTPIIAVGARACGMTLPDRHERKAANAQGPMTYDRRDIC